MEKKHKSFTIGMKRQRKTSLRVASSEPKNMKFDISDVPAIDINDNDKSVVPEIKTKTPRKKGKKNKANIDNEAAPPAKKLKKGIADILKPDHDASTETEPSSPQKTPVAKIVYPDKNMEEAEQKYPILKDKELIDKFLKVPMNNNQKGRIRQAIKLTLVGTTDTIFPDIINGKIQAILSSSTALTDSELRRVRILYNMLKSSLESPEELQVEDKPKKKKNKKKKERDGDKGEKQEGEGKKEVQKVKGPKRYVVFIGNLPTDINREMITEHFRELNEQIVDVRIPKRPADSKSAIAYVELSNEPSYELALSKHHSMLGSRRIKVLYSTQQKSKLSKAEAKSKSAKLIALQKAGKLVGSIPTGKKRSHRRNIMKKAKAKQAAATE